MNMYKYVWEVGQLEMIYSKGEEALAEDEDIGKNVCGENSSTTYFPTMIT